MADTLGIIITRYKDFDHISGVVKAARAQKHPVLIFLTDEGVRFPADAKFKELVKMDGVTISCCDHSCEMVKLAEKTDGITYGSQYNHATTLHDSARALIF